MATARALYEMARRNQAAMRAVENLLIKESLTVLSVGNGLGQQQMGGFLRKTVPGLIDRYGKVNATQAARYYTDRKIMFLRERGIPTASRQTRQNIRRQAGRRAAAELRSQIALARTPQFNPVAASQSPINYAMTIYQDQGFQPMRTNLTRALTRAVASYNRDTILYNSALDGDVVGVQRVAEPGACGFCRLQAIASIGQRRRFGQAPSYAVEYHNNCRCSIETLYEGDEVIRPEHYAEFEAQYEEAVATREAGQTVIERFNQLARTVDE